MAVSASDGSTASEWVPTGSVTVRVPGKVNLYLAVGDVRDDGYHDLTTVFHAVSLLDEVTVRNADMLSLTVEGEGVESVPTDERNLAWRAAELLAEHVGRSPDVAISIDKSIPVAGGMAGGSADAAAVLVALSVPLPWMAVLIANDRPPRRAEEPRRYAAGRRIPLFPTAERPARLPNTLMSSSELVPRRFEPCTETHAHSPAA